MPLISVAALCLAAGDRAPAQEDVDAAALANSPLASMTAFNIQNYYVGRQTEAGDTVNLFWLRYAQPFSMSNSKWLLHLGQVCAGIRATSLE